MSYKKSKELLSKFFYIKKLWKSIEFVTILSLQSYKTKLTEVNKLIGILFCYLKEIYALNYKDSNNLLILYLTDRSCSGSGSGIVNNEL